MAITQKAYRYHTLSKRFRSSDFLSATQYTQTWEQNNAKNITTKDRDNLQSYMVHASKMRVRAFVSVLTELNIAFCSFNYCNHY